MLFGTCVIDIATSYFKSDEVNALPNHPVLDARGVADEPQARGRVSTQCSY